MFARSLSNYSASQFVSETLLHVFDCKVYKGGLVCAGYIYRQWHAFYISQCLRRVIEITKFKTHAGITFKNKNES